MKSMRAWLEGHPLTGWYIAVMITLDFVLHILESNVL